MKTRAWGRGAAAGRPAMLAVLLAAAACGDRGQGADAPRERATEERRGGTAVIAETDDVAQPHPLFMAGALDSDMTDIMFMGLNRGVWRDGRLVQVLSDESPMALAWLWEYVGPDSTSIRYRMRSGVAWSDGKPITANDVVWTYRMYGDSSLASPRASNVSRIDSVVAENDSTVVFHFARRYPEMLFDSGLPVVPAHPYAGVAPKDLATHPSMTRVETMVVSGPFRFGARQPGQQITLVPNPHSPAKPLLDRIVIRIIPEPTTRLVELQNGTVDIARGVGFDRVPALRQAASNLRFENEGGRYWEYVGYNLRRPQFADPNVRRALGMAVDVPGIIQRLRMAEFVTQAAGPYPPLLKDFYNPQRMRPLAYDTAGAKRLLEAAGWRDTNGDGIREKDGRPFRFTLITNAGNQRRLDVSQILQRMWREVGVEVRLQQYDLGTVQDRQFKDHDFDAVLGSWGVELSGTLSTLFAPGVQLNFVGYEHPDLTRLLAEAEAQPTAAGAFPLWQAAAERIVQDQPYTWLYYYGPLTAIRDRLRDVRVDAFGAYQNSWEWWVSDAPGRGGGDTTKGDTAR